MKRINPFILCFLLLGIFSFKAISQPCSGAEVDNKLKEIRVLSNQKNIQRGLDTTHKYLTILRNQKDTSCIQFMKLLSLKGLLLLRNDMTGDALIMFTDLIHRLEPSPYKDLEAHAYLSLALLHELMDRPTSCKENLQKAYEVISKNNLKEPLTRYYVRYASYSRLFESEQDSCLYFTNAALKNIQFTSEINDVGDTYMLMMVCSQSKTEKIVYRNKAIDAYFRASDVIASLYLSFGVYEDMMADGRDKEAGRYLDGLKVRYLDVIDENSIEKYIGLTAYYKKKKAREIKQNNFIKALEYGELYTKYMKEYLDIKNRNTLTRIQDEFLYEKEQKRTEQLKEKSNFLITVLWISILVSAILLVLLYVTYINQQKIKKQKVIIEQSMIEVKNLNYKNEILLTEAHHRIKNSLQNIIGIIQIQKEKIKDKDSVNILNDLSNRVNCISLIHEELYQNDNFERINVWQYLSKIISLHGQITNHKHAHLFNLELDKTIQLNMDTTMPLGIIVNELVTNSLKHADVKSEALKIKISIFPIDQNQLRFEYSDNGTVSPNQDMKPGMGMLLIRSMVKQLHSDYAMNYENGYHFGFTFREKVTAVT